MIDFKKINQDLDALYIVQMLGMDNQWHGSRLYIRCPEHRERTGKEETNLDNCILNHNGYHCFSCQASGNITKLISKTLNIDLHEAAKTAAEVMGLKITNYMLDEEYTENGEWFPLTPEELSLLGLKGSVPCKNVNNLYYYKDEIARAYRYDAAHDIAFVSCQVQNVSLTSLWKEEKGAFEDMIKGKIIETYVDMRSVLESGILDFIFEARTAYQIGEGIRKEMLKLNDLGRRFRMPAMIVPKAARMKSRFRLPPVS